MLFVHSKYFIAGLCLASFLNEQLLAQHGGDSVEHSYVYAPRNLMGRAHLVLFKNGTFQYEISNDLSQRSAEGNWHKEGDTLVLNSFIQANNLPIKLQLSTKTTKGNAIYVSPVEDIRGTLVKDARIFFNRDTNNSCMPIFPEDCNVKGPIKMVKISLSPSLYSKWVTVTEKEIDTLKIVLDIENEFGKRIFFNNEKFIAQKTKLYPLEKSKGTHAVYRRDPSFVFERER